MVLEGSYTKVSGQDESHESKARQALMFCFENASPEKST